MKKIIPIARIELGEEEIRAALEVLNSGRLRQGEKTEEFERNFADLTGARFAVAVSSGTAALHIAYLSLLSPETEVLVPSFTFIATASMIIASNCKPVFCDIDQKTFTLDIEDLKKKITKHTGAIAPVHLFGNTCYINEIIKIAEERNLKIIWDAAQAHAAKYKGLDVGSFDDTVCYSFYPSKNMITGEGGMVTTNSSEIYEKLKLLRSHGQARKYFHTSLGFNYRMTDVEAAIGNEQLKKLDCFVQERRSNADYLTQNLSKIEGIVTPFVEDYVDHAYHQYTILLDLDKLRCTRDEFAADLNKEGIGTAVHYPRPLHNQPIFNKLCEEISLPVSETIANKILSLPVYPGLEKYELERIIQGIRYVVDRYGF